MKLTLENPPEGYEAEAEYRIPRVGEPCSGVYEDEVFICVVRTEARRVVLTPKKPQRWRAQTHATYYYVTDAFNTAHDMDEIHCPDGMRWEAGNYFRTRERAKEAAERMKKTLQDFQDELREKEEGGNRNA